MAMTTTMIWMQKKNTRRWMHMVLDSDYVYSKEGPKNESKMPDATINKDIIDCDQALPSESMRRHTDVAPRVGCPRP